MNNLPTTFSFEGNQVRTITKEGNPWWVLSDVCKALEVGHAPTAAKRLDDDEKSTVVINDSGNLNASRTIINESGLYSLILTSRKPSAKRFKKWVTSEVLPAIRQTGGYIAASREETPEQIMARALLVAQDTIERTKQENIKLSAEVKELSGCAAAYKSAFDTDGLMRLSEACRIIKQDYPEINMHRIPGYLVEAGYLYDSKSKAKPSWRVKVSSADTLKLFQQRVTGVCPYGSVIHIFVTREGFARLHDWAREGLLPVRKGLDF